MNGSQYKDGPPEEDKLLAEIRAHIVAGVEKKAVPAKITALAEELQKQLETEITSVSSGTRRPQK